EGSRDRHSGKRRFEIVEIPLQFGLPDITQLADADRERPTARKAGTRMCRKIAGEFPLVARGHAEPPEARPGPLLTPGDPLRHVVGEIRLRQFAIIDDVEPAFDLSLDDLRYPGSQPLIERRLVDLLA